MTVEINSREIEYLDQHKKNPDYYSSRSQIFIIGSKGIPAAYGGFETFVEKLTEYQDEDRLRYHVSRMSDNSERYIYNGAKCFNVSVPNIGPAKAVYYDVAALQRCINYVKARPSIKRPVFYVLACRIGPFIGYFKKQIEALGGILIVNPDGHEFKRSKWNSLIQKYWKYSESLMVKQADLLVCDSKNIEKYIQEEYAQFHPKTTFIAYGADIEPSQMTDDDPQFKAWLLEKGIIPGEYYLAVGRFVPENNYETMIREFMKSKSDKDFVLISNVSDKFLDELRQRTHFDQDPRIKFVGTVYDQQLLKKIREKAAGYLHGHEVGGTNPSLLEALSCTPLNLLLNVGFNQEVGQDAALYWDKCDGSLAALIDQADQIAPEELAVFEQKAKARIKDYYNWPNITHLYQDLFMELSKADV